MRAQGPNPVVATNPVSVSTPGVDSSPPPLGWVVAGTSTRSASTTTGCRAWARGSRRAKAGAGAEPVETPRAFIVRSLLKPLVHSL